MRNKGFTIIELLIVIAILVIILNIGFNSCVALHYSKSQRTESVEIITQDEESKQETPVEIQPLNEQKGEKKQL